MPELTPKGEYFLEYLTKKCGGEECINEVYEKTLQRMCDKLEESHKNTMNKYFKNHPNYKIIKARYLKEDMKFANILKGDIIEIYNPPFRESITLRIKLGKVLHFYIIDNWVSKIFGERKHHLAGENEGYCCLYKDVEIIE